MKINNVASLPAPKMLALFMSDYCLLVFLE